MAIIRKNIATLAPNLSLSIVPSLKRWEQCAAVIAKDAASAGTTAMCTIHLMTRRQFLITAVALALSRQALAQTTAKPVRIVVPFPAGGGTDVLARIVAEKLRGNYAPSVIVENRVGASGRTGVEAVKNAEPDGTTLLFTPDFLMTVYPHSFRKLSYDPIKDFTPIALVARSALGLAAGPALPPSVTDVKEYIAWAKAHPKQAFFADTSPGGT